MFEAWLSYCKHTFAQRIGSSTFTNAREAMAPMLELFDDLPLAELTIDHIEACREAMIDAGLHPDFPPEIPAGGETSELDRTLDYQEQV